MTRYLRFNNNRHEQAQAITSTVGAADASKLIATDASGLINPALITRASTTAGLGSGTVLGEVRLCTDCLTSLGEGGLVLWTGAEWRTLRDGIAPTTDYLTFFRSLVQEGTSRASSRLQFAFSDQLFGPNTINVNLIVSGAGSSAGNQSNFSIPHAGVAQLATGSTVTGGASRGTTPAALNGWRYLAMAFCIPTLSSATQEFACRVGIAEGTAEASTFANYTANGLNLIYDRANVSGSLAAGSDNWIVKYRNGTPEYIDTGIAVDSNASTFEFVEILISPTAHQLYFNNLLVLNKTSGLFSGATYNFSSGINKTTGTSGRLFRFSWEAYGFYFPAAINRFAN
jgi:hypothetical protein